MEKSFCVQHLGDARMIMGETGLTTIVSVTPLAVERDSRTFKMATSIGRLSGHSIVIEGERSNLERANLPFELRSLSPRSLDELATRSVEDGQSSQRTILRTLIDRVKQSPLWRPMAWLGYVYRHVYWYGLRTLLKAPKASLYYLHAFYQFPAIYLLSRIRHVPYIYDAHDFYSGIEEADALSRLRKYLVVPFERWLEAQCVKRAAAVVTVSEGIAQLQHQAFGCMPVVICNSHDLRLDQEPPQHIRTILNLPREAFLLVAVGRPKPGRATEEAMKAMLALPSTAHLAFVGQGYEQYQKVIQNNGLGEQVHIVSPVKPYEVVPFIRSADAALILYYARSVNYENALPNGFFQSIAAELPLLYPALPEMKKLAERYSLGIPINPQDSSSIAAAVTELMNNPNRYAAFKRNLQVAKGELSWEKEEIILYDLIAQVLEQDPNARH